MKTRLWIACLVITFPLVAQTKVEKSIPVKSGQKLNLDFDYPEVKLHTWDKADILVTGTVSINKGENDNAFELEINSTASGVSVKSHLKDKENIPHRIAIKKGDREYYFKASNYNDPEVQKFLEENGREYSYMSNGIIQEIKLEVFVPKNIETLVVSKYGLVEVLNFEAPLTIDAKYGGIDASIQATGLGQLTARSQYGEILSNLDVKFNQQTSGEKSNKRWTEISALLGNGPKYSLDSKYGNVYLRKTVK